MEADIIHVHFPNLVSVDTCGALYRTTAPLMGILGEVSKQRFRFSAALGGERKPKFVLHGGNFNICACAAEEVYDLSKINVFVVISDVKGCSHQRMESSILPSPHTIPCHASL